MTDTHGTTNPNAPTAEEIVLELCNELKITPADLENLPADFLATVIATGRGSNAEKAAQHLALHKLKTFRAQQAPQQDLAGYFRERDQRELFPWKTAESAAKVQHDSFVRAFREPNPMENLKRIFLAQAKGGLIAPTENVVLQHLLFGESDYARFTLASLLLTVPVPNRLAVHNWNVAASGISAGKPRERMRGTRSQKTSKDSRRGDCRLFLSWSPFLFPPCQTK